MSPPEAGLGAGPGACPRHLGAAVQETLATSPDPVRTWAECSNRSVNVVSVCVCECACARVSTYLYESLHVSVYICD